MPKYASVYLLDAPLSLDRAFDYRIPDGIEPLVTRGSIVSVPFSGANRLRSALVASVKDESDSEKVKDIADVNRFVTLNEEQLSVCEFLKEYTVCTTGDAVRTVTPPRRSVENARDRLVLFARKKAFSGTAELQNDASEKKRSKAPKGAKQLALLSALTEEFRPVKELFSESCATVTQLKSLAAMGLCEIKAEAEFKNPYADIKIDESRKNVLSPHQKSAYDKLCSLYESHTPKCALLFGVTGSGKTRVMKALIDRVVADDRQVIVLVPEISLTPQTVSLFCSFYGERVAVLHSSLSDTERFDAYRRIKNGGVDLVIGTRSAVFAPLPRLGAIIIDEEQEHTYKSDMNPKYHAKDVAAYRLGKCGGLLLLASATPSVESYYKAVTGTYTLVELTERYGNARLPAVFIDDMRKNAAAGNLSPFGKLLSSELETRLSAGEQAILFLNRRGYNAFLSCKDCGEAVLCPHCSVSLTRHRDKTGDYMLCHYCGYRSPHPKKCPSCGGSHLAFMGYGTQKVEEEFTNIYGKKLLRMDADTTVKKSSYEQLLGDFRSHKADALLGTQMVAKGHDFPDVTLVGVLNADASLYLDDFRAGERTFSMLTQVIGRAGRAEKHGVAVIQTLNPKNEVILLAARQDYKAFYKRDISFRESFTFPPFCDIAVISVSGISEDECTKCSYEIFEYIKAKITGEYRNIPIISFGPFEAPLYKLDETYRMRIVLKCRRTKRLLSLLSDIVKEFSAQKYKKTYVGVDINPTNI